MSAFDDLDKLAARIDPILRNWYQSNRFGAQAQIELHDIAEVIKQIASSPGIHLLKSMAQDAARQAIKDDTFSPAAAAVPAQDRLLALSDIERAAEQLATFCKSERFKSERFKPARMQRGKQRVSARVSPAEFVEQMVYLTGLLLMATTQCRYAVDKLLRLEDPRRSIAMLNPPANPANPAELSKLLTLTQPTAPTLSPPSTSSEPAAPAPRKGSKGSKEADKMLLDLRGRTLALAERLRQAAVTGRERLHAASLGGRAYSPNVVGAEAYALSRVIADALTACAQITDRAVEPPTGLSPKSPTAGDKARSRTPLGLWLWFVVGGLAAVIGLALIVWGLFGFNQSSSSTGHMLVLVGLTIEVAVTVTLAIRITIARDLAANRRGRSSDTSATPSSGAPPVTEE